ncbi:TlpA family protein disulfide reductase [Acidobacteriota bacterium]
MNKFIRKNWVYLLISVFIFVNIIFFVNNNLNKKDKAESLIQQESSQQIQAIIPVENTDFYNRPCPELSLTSIDGEQIELKNLIGNVIILKFSRFYKRDLPNLIYLEHLAGKFKNLGVSLVFINSLGRHYKKEIEKICSFISPVVEDQGSIAGLLNASLEDTIIVDRDFSIKSKYQVFDKRIIYSDLKRWTQNDGNGGDNFSNENLETLLKDLFYFDVLEKEEKPLFDPTLNKKVIITLFTSICTGCEENSRIQLLKDISSGMNKKYQTVFLFGFGNNEKNIRQYALLNNWDKFPISIGVIEGINSTQLSDYYDLFDFNVDPRTIILDSSGTVLFQEYLKDINSVTEKFFRKFK